MNSMADMGLETKPAHEGKVTTRVEEQTAQVPSGIYLSLAIGSMIASATLRLAGKKDWSNFVGQWVPSLLVIGVYNKLVKVEHELLEAMAARG